MTLTPTNSENPGIADFDLRALPPGFHADPYSFYRQMRAECPVLAMPDGSYFLTRHADLIAVYRSAVIFSSDKKREFMPKYGDTPLFQHHTSSLVFNDPPLHTRVRKLIMGALTLRAITGMEAGLIDLVDRLLDAAQDKSCFDLIEDFAAAIPIEVIGNLLGVPLADRGPLRGWSLAILGALEPALTNEQMARGNQAVRDFLDYLRLLVAERRRSPGDPGHDVLTRMIQGERDGGGAGGGERDGGGEILSENELLHNCIFLLNAGHETTTNLIGNALATLLDWPDQRTRLIGAPALIHTAVEECLRFESSNQLGNRITTQPTEIGGVYLPQGTPITLCIGAANRDPDVFADPDRLDLARDPNRHLAFGFGTHQCAGLSLARLEGRIAIQRFLTRFPRYHAAGEAVRGGRARFRGFLSFPVRVS